MKNRHPFWFLFYNFAVIPALFIGLQIARLFNPKVRQGIQGRKDLFRRLTEVKKNLPDNRKLILIHCASAGEFEAARPVLSAIKKRLPDASVHVTCFSPSGLKPISKAEDVDSYSYLPFDDFISIQRLFRILNPSSLMVVKHDVWPNLVWTAARRKIPTLWINANLHEKSKRLGWISRGFNRAFLSRLNAVLTVDDSHAERLASLISPKIIEVVGDSRYDRTMDRMKRAEPEAEKILPSAWFEGKKVLVGGSTWGPDQRILIPAFARLKKEHPELYLILVPHEPHPHFLADTEYYLRGYGLNPIRYSQVNGSLPASDVLVVDKVGILAMLYRAAWVAYIGGAFGEGVHSVLEPAVYGLPLFFGPKYYMSHEAEYLVQRGAAHSVNSTEELENRLRLYLEDDQTWQVAAQESMRVVESGLGATERIVERLQELLADQKEIQ